MIALSGMAVALMTPEEMAETFGDRPMHPDRPHGSIERARRLVAQCANADGVATRDGNGRFSRQWTNDDRQAVLDRALDDMAAVRKRQAEVTAAVREGLRRASQDCRVNSERHIPFWNFLSFVEIAIDEQKPIPLTVRHIRQAWRDAHAV